MCSEKKTYFTRMKGNGRRIALAGILILLFSTLYGQDSVSVGEIANDSVAMDTLANDSASLGAIASDSVIAGDSVAALGRAAVQGIEGSIEKITKVELDYPIPGLPLSMITLLVIGLVLLTALIAAILMGLERLYKLEIESIVEEEDEQRAESALQLNTAAVELGAEHGTESNIAAGLKPDLDIESSSGAESKTESDAEEELDPEPEPEKRKKSPKELKLAQSLKNTRILRKLFIVGMLIFIAGFWIHQQIKGTPWEGHVNEWMNLIVRWTHITFGVAWIGASFYFIFLENALYRGPGIRKGLAGNLWAIHGGGFYYVEKYKVAPEKLPRHLHWFKWEAYITWISGISLLFVVYYFNASSVLVDKSVADISSGAAIAIGISTLVLSWFVYDILCKSPVVENKPLFFFVMLGFLTFIAFFLSQWLSSRAAYLHVGAVIGTMMAGNVWRTIIPSQKAMVKAAEENRPVDPELGRHSGIRSLHNNYFTLPVLFIMVSNHFPSTYGNALNWAVLGALTLISAGVKHYFNLKDKGEKNPFLIPAAAFGMFVVFLYTAPQMASDDVSDEASQEKVEFYQVYQVITRRCTSCHSEKPTDDVNVIAPENIMFDRPDQIIGHKDRIMVRAVVTKTMPQNNKTGMTDQERNLIKRWVDQGANGFQ